MSKTLTAVVGSAAMIVGLGAAAPATASADDTGPAAYCQGGPDTNRFGDPHYMYEISMGAKTRFDQNGDPAINALGDPTGVLWNGEERDLSMGDHLYLRYDGGDGSYGVHPNTPTDGARINFTFAGGEQWTADVNSNRNGCEPQVKWTEGFLPFEPEPEPLPVVRPKVKWAQNIKVNKRFVRLTVEARQPKGTQSTKRGAYYRVVIHNPRTDRSRFAGSGRVQAGDADRVKVNPSAYLPRAKKHLRVQVISYGKRRSNTVFHPTKKSRAHAKADRSRKIN